MVQRDPPRLELTLVRHGETAWNAVRRIQGSIEIELNPTGHAQAAAIGLALARRQGAGAGERFHRLISSDQIRAAQTAAAIAQATGLELTFDPGLRERRYGVFEGCGYDEIETRWPEDWARWQNRDPAWGPPDGETLSGFDARVRAWLDHIAADPGSRPLTQGEPLRVIAVTHGGVLDMAFRRAAGLALQAPRQHQTLNAARNVLALANDTWEVVVWADTDHLAHPADDL